MAQASTATDQHECYIKHECKVAMDTAATRSHECPTLEHECVVAPAIATTDQHECEVAMDTTTTTVHECNKTSTSA